MKLTITIEGGVVAVEMDGVPVQIAASEGSAAGVEPSVQAEPNWPVIVSEIMLHRGWKTADMARHLGTSGPNVSRWRLGTIKPSSAVRTVLLQLHAQIASAAA